MFVLSASCKMKASLCSSSSSAVRCGAPMMAISVDIQRKHSFYTCESFTHHSCKPYYFTVFYFILFIIFKCFPITDNLDGYFFSRFFFRQIVNVSKKDIHKVIHPVFIQQLMWMYYFIHELFPEFIKQ